MEETPKKSYTVPIAIIVAVALLIGAIVFVFRSNQPTQQQQSVPVTTVPTIPPTVTPSSTESARVITVTGTTCSFTPAEIRIKKGETVKIAFTNAKGTHDFVIDELNVRIPVIKAGETENVVP